MAKTHTRLTPCTQIGSSQVWAPLPPMLGLRMVPASPHGYQTLSPLLLMSILQQGNWDSERWSPDKWVADLWFEAMFVRLTPEYTFCLSNHKMKVILEGCSSFWIIMRWKRMKASDKKVSTLRGWAPHPRANAEFHHCLHFHFLYPGPSCGYGRSKIVNRVTCYKT